MLFKRQRTCTDLWVRCEGPDSANDLLCPLLSREGSNTTHREQRFAVDNDLCEAYFVIRVLASSGASSVLLAS